MKSFLEPPKHILLLSKDKIDSVYKSKRMQVFIGIFIGYAGYYLVRKNFSLAMPHLEQSGFTKESLGLVLSANAIAYGLSKFIMGGISDRSDARKFLALGLILSSLATFLLGTAFGVSSIAIMFMLQFLIGWFQGMGWPPCGRVMTHWFSQNERGTKMSFWNVAHNVGGGLMGPLVMYGTLWFGSWQKGAFWFPAIVGIVIALISLLLVRDTPQSCGLPPIEEYRNDYPNNYSKTFEEELSTKEIFLTYVLRNKMLWFIAIANAFVYLVRYGVLDWAPTYLESVKHYNIKEVGWAYSAYEWAAIPGTIVCGWLSDKVFRGKRSITTIIYMLLVMVFVFVYWKNMDNKFLDGVALIAIGFLVYGPVMLIGVQALDLAPKKAAGAAAGLTGLLGYLLGTAILANITIGYLVEHYGWDAGFMLLIVACVLSIVFVAFTYGEEKRTLENSKK
ncbi:glycerol-3-phosphate transporter [Riemerella columbipharyngis]|uniref:Glycerol-3-phosphate transporter n=1 Tax=Riemerella columbipharyngis TaxID=1071918 RepID=A0A1G6YJZ3_9FLAO|nr:glycerol-3-phosphate transporter [Riemerella columbipharyngis]SDD90313.1 MFS transporter, OPA family, glycerol-3-phosphate transporter [Riemerella columbipharyngis]